MIEDTGDYRHKILLVDDEPANIRVLQNLLKDKYEILFATSGAMGLKIVDQELPDLILLDVMMPEMDGYETLRRLKENEHTRDIPVIFVTAMNDVNDEREGLQLGAVDYITKPISPPILEIRVQNHLELKRQRDLLQAQNKKLAELDQIKNRFLGMAAHDLRNPLISIRGLSEMLLSVTLSLDKQQKFFKTIHQVSNQMLNLVNDLLDIAVIESGQLKLHSESSNLSALVSARTELLVEGANAKGIELITELADTPDSLFDSDRISQVIDNLLTNAIKFSNSGTSIRLSTRLEGDQLALLVQDQGPGLSESEQEKLFGAFQKLSTRPTAGEKSTGLGLSIVKKIIEAHCGKIRVESCLGSGTTFTVLLPLISCEVEKKIA